jgi:hypothetical protein
MIFTRKKPPTKHILSDIKHIPLRTWIEIYTTGDISLLVKSGTYTEQEINDNWGLVIEQYLSHLSDKKSDAQTALKKRIAILNQRLQHIDACMAMMQLYGRQTEWNEALMIEFERTRTHLHSLGFPYQFLDINSDLIKIQTRKQSMIIELRGLEKQLLTIAQSGETSNPTQYEWDMQLEVIAKHRGFPFDLDNTTVSQYLAALNEFKRSAQAQKEALNGK